MMKKKLLSMFTLLALICTTLISQIIPVFADESGDYDSLLEEADAWCEDYSCELDNYNLDWAEDWLADWGWMSEYDNTTDIYVVWDAALSPEKVDELLAFYDEFMESGEITPSGDYAYSNEPAEEETGLEEPTYDEWLDIYQTEFNYWCEDYSCIDDDYLCDEDWLEDWLDDWGWMGLVESGDDLDAAYEIWSTYYDAELVDIWMGFAQEYYETNELNLDCEEVDGEEEGEFDYDEDYYYDDYDYDYDDSYDQEYINDYQDEVDEWCDDYGCENVELSDKAWVEVWVQYWGFDILYDVWDPILGYETVDALWEESRDYYDDQYDDDEYYYEYDYDNSYYKDQSYSGYDDYAYENSSYLDFLHLEENVEELWWILDTLEEVYIAYEESDSAMSEGLNSALDEMAMEVESLLHLMETILELGPNSDHGDIVWAHEKFYDLMSRGPWELLDYAFEDLDSMCFYEDIGSELEYLLEDLKNFKTFIDAFEKLGVNDSELAESTELLKDIAGDVRYRVETIFDKYQAGEVSSDEAWDVLDGLADVEALAMGEMEVIVEYLLDHENLLEELFVYIPDQTEMVMMWVYEWDPDQSREDNDYCASDEYYNHTDEGYLDDEEFEEMIRYIPSHLWDELVTYFGEDGAREFLLSILMEIDTYGDLGVEFLENYSDIYREIDFAPEDLRHHGERVAAIFDALEDLYVPDEYAEKMIDLIEKLKILNDSDATEASMLVVVDNLELNLKSIEYANYHGNKATKFYDVPEEEWMGPYVRKVKTSGIVKGYSDDNGPTGYYGPADDVLLIEVLAISMRLAGEADTDTAYPGGYLERLDDLGITELNSVTHLDWASPATRLDALIIMNKVLGIEGSNYIAGTFPDVTGEDSYAADAMASYNAGFFTGEGGTGNLNPGAYMNRAAFAKVAGVAFDYLDEMAPGDIDAMKAALDALVESL